MYKDIQKCRLCGQYVTGKGFVDFVIGKVDPTCPKCKKPSLRNANFFEKLFLNAVLFLS